MRIVVAIDSFKGSLTSMQAAEAVKEAALKVNANAQVEICPLADGGEGTVDALSAGLGGTKRTVSVSGPLGTPVDATYCILPNQTAVIEMAAAAGLPLVPADKRNPMETTTYGVGELIKDAISHGCRHFIVGIGGSATNDCGIGMLHALGYRFVDAEGQEIAPCGEALARIDRIDDSGVMAELKECEFVVACDVTNPLYGPNGAAHVFAPQKGATPQMVEQLDGGLRNFARVVREYNGFRVDFVEGAGAAGGLGAGFVGVLGAKLQRGIDMVMEALRFEDVLRGSDLAITGEGCIDFQTVMGKAPSGVLHTATRLGIPVVAIGGGVRWCKELEKSNFATIVAATPEGMELQEAMRPEVAKENVRRTTEQLVRKLVESK